jgi:hypothetical protein
MAVPPVVSHLFAEQAGTDTDFYFLLHSKLPRLKKLKFQGIKLVPGQYTFYTFRGDCHQTGLSRYYCFAEL